jgi:N-acetylglucosaminyldiphosphoundecaprenol N-acetyl-beta-D-mannosaminyltransferase
MRPVGPDFEMAPASNRPAEAGEPPTSREILGVRVDATSYTAATEQIVAWSGSDEGRWVCVANVHTTMEAWDDPGFRQQVNQADLVTPDGMPLVWALRKLGVPEASRVYGPTLTLHVCERAARDGVPVGFYGGSAAAIERLVPNLATRFPNLRVVFAESPPFRPLTAEEDEGAVERINGSGARLLFVGLGCPKQERWMATHRQRLPLVQIGVGAAFDFHAGLVRQAPPTLQSMGLEWAFRMAMEPRRLAKRYLRHNPRFVWQLLRQLRGSGRPGQT